VSLTLVLNKELQQLFEISATPALEVRLKELFVEKIGKKNLVAPYL
jgi:hypothetical protein